MSIESQYMADVEEILSHRYDNGADLWTTPDKRLLKGSPFSTFESVLYLLELGMSPKEPVLKAAADLIFKAWKEDGRFKIYPKGAIYLCQTANAAKVMCCLGYAEDYRLRQTFFLQKRFAQCPGHKTLQGDFRKFKQVNKYLRLYKQGLCTLLFENFYQIV